jgi:tetratricopeptide (TPR) repeat protein
MNDLGHSADHGGALAHLEPHMVASYIERRLLAAEAAAVEAHLADCAECRKEMLQLSRIVGRRRFMPPRFIVAALAAAAAAVIFLAAPRLNGVSNAPIRALGNVVQPPIYLGIAVRAPAGGGSQLFAEAMGKYAAGDYAGAAARLRAAQAAGVNGTATAFFLGASLLMLNEPRGAAEQFTAVIRLGPSPYLSEAHYYRAKALLRLDDPDGALAELDESLDSVDAGLRVSARLLQDSIRAARGP